MASEASLIPIFEGVAPQLLATKFAFISLFTVNLYDHFLTFPDEVKFIWQRKFTPVTILFFINRYIALGIFCVVIAGFFSPLIDSNVCEHFGAFYPFAGLAIYFCPSIIVGLRVYALYHKKLTLAIFLAGYLIVEFAVNLWVYGTPGEHPLVLPENVQGDSLDALHICTELTAESLGSVKSAIFLFMQAIYDSVIFGLIIFKTATSLRERRHDSIHTILAAQGLIYFFVIFFANLLWALMVIFAPSGLKYSTGMPTLELVCAVVNRMTIELRKEGPSGHDSMVSSLPMDIPLRFFKGKLKSGEATVTVQSD